ncbi:hypothetical protein PRUPE_1G043000 [Prunus persica]|uniref:Uncharacterized protein n=1 Tax=Prunus persica TaxID=3760 RepID=A0A251QSF9_PRUPE|nr:hypothetical protein PRUPE_1G043000 [Prunus persica]
MGEIDLVVASHAFSHASRSAESQKLSTKDEIFFSNNHVITLSCLSHSIVYGLLCTLQCQWVYSCMYRHRLRQKFVLPDEPCGDCCVHFFCEPCALCQEHDELKSRGFNPSKGWIGPPTLLHRCLLR